MSNNNNTKINKNGQANFFSRWFTNPTPTVESRGKRRPLSTASSSESSVDSMDNQPAAAKLVKGNAGLKDRFKGMKLTAKIFFYGTAAATIGAAGYGFAIASPHIAAAFVGLGHLLAASPLTIPILITIGATAAAIAIGFGLYKIVQKHKAAKAQKEADASAIRNYKALQGYPEVKRNNDETASVDYFRADDFPYDDDAPSISDTESTSDGERTPRAAAPQFAYVDDANSDWGDVPTQNTQQTQQSNFNFGLGQEPTVLR